MQGEVQKKLDIIANEVLIEANEWGGHLAAMAPTRKWKTFHVILEPLSKAFSCAERIARRQAACDERRRRP
jgi:hypothetical protein